jgi:hypothetical protein
MVPLLFSNVPYTIHKLLRLFEIVKHVLLAEMMFVNNLPTLELGLEPFDFVAWEWRYTAPTRNTLSIC